MRFKSRSRALATSALAAALGLAGLGLVAPAAQAAPAETSRIAGDDRYDTAADIATASYPAADTVVLTTGEKLPDALSANPIAGANNAPILLTLTDSIPASTQAALDGINPTNVIIVGGTAAVSAEVEAALQADGYTVTREAGADRFATAAEVARQVGTAPAIDADGAGEQAAMATVALANGITGLPDAVAASPMLHQLDIPLLLTGPDTLNEDAAAAIQALNAEQVLILGGTAAVSLNIEQELQNDGVNAERIAGNDRWGTATAIADFELDFLGFDAGTTYIASGFSLADALAGGPLASQTNSPIVLVSETSVPAPTTAWLEEHAAEINRIVALGGTAVINDSVVTEASQAADEEATTSPVVTSLSLTPETDINAVGTQHTVTATAVNQSNTPVENATVTFEVYRESPTNGQGTPVHTANVATDANGDATFTYTGPDAQNDDVIIACVDDDQVADGCDATATFDPETADTATTAEVDDYAVKYWVETLTATDATFIEGTDGTSNTGTFGDTNGDQVTITYTEAPVADDGDSVTITAGGQTVVYICGVDSDADLLADITCTVSGTTLVVELTDNAEGRTDLVIDNVDDTVDSTEGVTDVDGNPDAGFPVAIDAD